MNKENIKEQNQITPRDTVEGKIWGSAVILAVNPDKFEEGYMIENQLSRTADYCTCNSYDVWRVYVVDDMTGTVPFYRMIDYIKRADYPVYIVVDSADRLFLNDPDKAALLSYFYYSGKIQIHLVTEDIVLQNPRNKKEQKIWAKISHIPPALRSGIHKGIKAGLKLEQERAKDESNKAFVQ